MNPRRVVVTSSLLLFSLIADSDELEKELPLVMRGVTGAKPVDDGEKIAKAKAAAEIIDGAMVVCFNTVVRLLYRRCVVCCCLRI